MIEKLSHIDPRQINDVKQLQDMLVLVINVCDELHTLLEEARAEIRSLKDETVSYTHLTLPTIYSV